MALLERGSQLRTLRNAYAQAAAISKPVIVTLSGDAGIGKSALLEAFEKTLTGSADTNLAVLHGQASYSSSESAAYVVLRDALEDLIRSAARQGKLPRLLRSLIETAPTWVAAAIPGLGLLAAGVETILAMGKSAADRADGGEFREEYVALLRRQAAEGTVVLILDDLHWADRSSLDLIFQLPRKLRECRILIVLAFRTLELADDHPLILGLQTLRRYDEVVDINLGPIGMDTVAAIVGHNEGAPSDDRLTEWLYDMSEGNPLFVEEFLRLLHTEKRLVRLYDKTRFAPRHGILEPDELPPRLESVLAYRVDRVSKEERRLLQAASIVGTTFDIADVIPLVTLPEDRVLASVETLTQDHRLLRSFADGRRYAFYHKLIRQFVEERLQERDPLTYSRLHLRHGEYLENRAVDVSLPVLEPLARHFHLGLDHRRAYDYSMLAAEAAIQTGALSEACVLSTWAIEHAASVGNRLGLVEAHLLAGRVFLDRIDAGNAKTHFSLGLGVLGESAMQVETGLTTKLLLGLTHAFSIERAWSACWATLDQLTQLRPHMQTELQAETSVMRAGAALFGGFSDRYGLPEAIADALEGSHLSASPRLLSSSHRHLAMLALSEGAIHRARREISDARTFATASGSVSEAFQALLFNSYIDLATLEVAAAKDIIDELAAMSERFDIGAMDVHRLRSRLESLSQRWRLAAESMCCFLVHDLAADHPGTRMWGLNHLELTLDEAHQEFGPDAARELAGTLFRVAEEQFSDLARYDANLMSRLATVSTELNGRERVWSLLERRGLRDYRDDFTARRVYWSFLEDLYTFRRNHGFEPV